MAIASTSSTPAIIAGMTTDVAGFIACDCAASRVPPAASCTPSQMPGTASELTGHTIALMSA
jgi:hypothetical protein